MADPELHREVKALAPVLARRAAPCGQEAVRLALQPAVLVFGVPESAKHPAFWAEYYKALSPLPAEALAKGLDDYMASPKAEFFPKPGPLRAFCERHAVPIRAAAYRAKLAAEAKAPKPINRGTPEQRRAFLAALPGGAREIPKSRPNFRQAWRDLAQQEGKAREPA